MLDYRVRGEEAWVAAVEGIRFSVVIPLYKGAPTIERALRSVLTQSCPAQEIVVVDDGSPDDSAEVVRRFLQSERPGVHPEIRLLQQPNRGAAAARNQGVRQASGNWIAFLDQDDAWLPSKLERQREAIREHPASAWCITGFRLHVDGVYREALLPRANVIARQHRFRNCFGPSSCLAVRRDAFLAVGGFREDLGTSCEDWDLAVRLYRRYPLSIVSEPLVDYHDTSASASRSGMAMLESELKLVETLLAGLTGVKRALARRQILASMTARAARNVPPGSTSRLLFAFKSLWYWPWPSVAGPRLRLVLAALRALGHDRWARWWDGR